MTPTVWVAIVAAVITLSALLFGVYQFRYAHSKAFAWSVLVNASLMREAGQIDWPDLVVSYQGQQVSEPRIIIVRLENTGRNELKKDDIDTAPTLKLDPAKILAVTVTLSAEGSKDLKLAPKETTEATVKLDPLVLNPADALTFTVLVDGNPIDLDLVMRAAGFQVRHSDYAADRATQRHSTLLATLSLGVSAVAFVVLLLSLLTDLFK